MGRGVCINPLRCRERSRPFPQPIHGSQEQWCCWLPDLRDGERALTADAEIARAHRAQGRRSEPLNLEVGRELDNGCAPGTTAIVTGRLPWDGINAHSGGHIRRWWRGFLKEGNVCIHLQQSAPSRITSCDIP